ncbi:glycosyltransferase [bacterium]|nr:glycosyltransferase [bacterium]
MPPLISVVMSTYNRANLLPQAIESVLNQSFDDFEFIIVNDNSTDNTDEILKSYKDNRVKIFTNKTNCGCTFNYHNENTLSKGKYIAHIDDDDIWLDKKLERQYEYMENNQWIAITGTYIETFGDNVRPSWIFYTEPKEIDFSMNFYNPICHSSVMYRKDYIEKNGINYDITKRCAQDFDFYKQIILSGGNIVNIPEVLVKYRMHPIRLTDIIETQQIQIDVAEKTKAELRARYLNKEEEERFKYLTEGFPFNEYNKYNVLGAVQMLENKINKTDINFIKAIDKIKTDILNNLYKF